MNQNHVSQNHVHQHHINNNISVLMIEDEEDICEAVVSYLALEGFSVHGVSNTIQADNILAQQKVDIIVLDLGLPDKDGLEWLKETKIMLNIGVIIATARADLSDKLQGLSTGADAYLIKPVEYDELILLIRNIYNRLHPHSKTELVNHWQLNLSNWSLICPNDKAVELTKSEFTLLKTLFEHNGQSVSKVDIIQQLGHTVESYDFRRMETLIRRLRNKINHETGLTIPLKTIHATGYAFVGDVDIF